MDFATLLKPEAVKVLTSTSSKKRLMHDLSEIAEHVYGLPSGEVLDALISRETLGPTGVGHGVAIPHARMESLTSVVGERGITEVHIQRCSEHLSFEHLIHGRSRCICGFDDICNVGANLRACGGRAQILEWRILT